METDLLLSQIDHLVYAAPDLADAVEHVEELLGVRPQLGGQHPGWGTHNALISFGSGRYLEIIGPDPRQPRPKEGRAFGIDTLKRSRLARWAAKGADLGALHASARSKGVDLGAVRAGSRSRPDGTIVKWQLTDPWTDVADGLIPFFIDWGDSPHPSTAVTAEAKLVSLRAEHPDPECISQLLEHLGLYLPVTSGPKPKLIAVLEGEYGRVELE